MYVHTFSLYYCRNRRRAIVSVPVSLPSSRVIHRFASLRHHRPSPKSNRNVGRGRAHPRARSRVSPLCMQCKAVLFWVWLPRAVVATHAFRCASVDMGGSRADTWAVDHPGRGVLVGVSMYLGGPPWVCAWKRGRKNMDVEDVCGL